MSVSTPPTPTPASGVPTRLTRVLRLAVIHPDASLRRDRTANGVALLAGLIFVGGGLAKFVFHAWELRAFQRFGLPAPQLMVIMVGVTETAGGILLILRLLVAPVAVTLAGVMVVAVAVSGIGHGDVIPSLTLAPALLAAMLFLLARIVAAARG